MINGYKSVNEDKKREDKTYFVLLLLCSIILILMDSDWDFNSILG
jgi:hypothetical protein